MSDVEHFNGETDAEAGTEETAPVEGQSADMELFEQYLEQGIELDLPGRGDLREGVIVEIRPSELLVNVGSKRDGVVPQSDLARLDPEFVKSLHEGQVVDVVIARQPDDDGIFVLSMSDALQMRDWEYAQALLDNGEITAHRVVGFNKGGITVEFNHLRGFVPASHIVDMPRNLSEDQRRTELESRIGQELRLKVIEVEKRRRRLVMSESLAERELQAERRAELFETLHVGDVLTGEVRSMRPFGAFVDIGGADGLLHVSEIGWSNVNHPREVLEVGQTIDVQVIRIDPDQQRIGLSRKRLLENPWDSVEERYAAGMSVPATITRVVDFGAFAELEPGIEGLIHISELADITVAEPLKTVRVGDRVAVKVLRVDRRRQRVGLSLRQADITIEDLMPEEEPEPETLEEPVAMEEPETPEEPVAMEAAPEVMEEPETPEEPQAMEPEPEVMEESETPEEPQAMDAPAVQEAEVTQETEEEIEVVDDAAAPDAASGTEAAPETETVSESGDDGERKE